MMLLGLAGAAWFAACASGTDPTGPSGSAGSGGAASSSTANSGGSSGIGGGFGGFCANGCSDDLSAVVDCDGNILTSCTGTDGCNADSLSCTNGCEAAESAKRSIGCEYYATFMDQLTESVLLRRLRRQYLECTGAHHRRIQRGNAAGAGFCLSIVGQRSRAHLPALRPDRRAAAGRSGHSVLVRPGRAASTGHRALPRTIGRTQRRDAATTKRGWAARSASPRTCRWSATRSTHTAAAARR